MRHSFLIKIIFILFCFVGLTGCWDQVELTERGFVMGLAIDQAEDGKIEVTTQVYKPTQNTSSGQKSREGEAFINIKTEDRSIFEAVADIPIHLSRRAQFSHMRIIIIGEDFAKQHNINEILDFFSRNNEPRLTNNVIIAKGRASDYLKVKPLIENTSSQEIRQAQRSASERSSKSIKMTLYRLFLQLRGQTGNAVMPYVSYDSEEKALNVSGAALIKKGKLAKVFTPYETERLIMLLNEYDYGIIEITCQNGGKSTSKLIESMEVIDADTKIQTKITEQKVKLKVINRITGSVSEMHCSNFQEEKAVKKFLKNAEERLKQGMQEVMGMLQEEKLDVLGIADQVYRQDPQLWKKIKKDWDKYFASAEVEYDIKISISDTGMFIGKSVGQK